MSNGSKPLTGLLSWEPAEELVEKIRSIGPWYIHSPEQGEESLFVAEPEEASAFLAARIEDVKGRGQGAGWVYVHTPERPSWIKIYDPWKCASCGTRTPKAWWEMTIQDAGESLPAEPSAAARKGLFHWLNRRNHRRES